MPKIQVWDDAIKYNTVTSLLPPPPSSCYQKPQYSVATINYTMLFTCQVFSYFLYCFTCDQGLGVTQAWNFLRMYAVRSIVKYSCFF